MQMLTISLSQPEKLNISGDGSSEVPPACGRRAVNFRAVNTASSSENWRNICAGEYKLVCFLPDDKVSLRARTALGFTIRKKDSSGNEHTQQQRFVGC